MSNPAAGTSSAALGRSRSTRRRFITGTGALLAASSLAPLRARAANPPPRNKKAQP